MLEPNLHKCVMERKLNFLKERLRDGCNVNKKDANGRTVLHLAVGLLRDRRERFEVCQLLLDNGADVNTKDANGSTVLFYVLRFYIGLEVNDNIDLFDLMLANGADVNYEDAFERTPFTEAIDSGNIDAIRKLLARGAKPNKSPEAFLLESIAKHNNDHVKLWLDYGANPGCYSHIRRAVTEDQPAILQMLVECGAKTNCKESVNCLIPPSSETLCKLLVMAEDHTLEILLENYVDMSTYNKCHVLGPCPCLLNNVYLNYDQLYHDHDAPHTAVLRSEEILQTVLKHVAVLIGSSRTEILESTVHLLEHSQYVRKSYEKYFKQVELMKTVHINKNSKVSFLDFLSKQGKALMDCCDDEELTDLKQEEVIGMFPDYIAKIARRFQTGKAQRRIRTEFTNMLYTCMNSRLPIDAIFLIADSLTLSDMKKALFE